MNDDAYSTHTLCASPMAQPELAKHIASALDSIASPTTFELSTVADGTRVRGYGKMFDAFATVFAALTRHALRWKQEGPTDTASPDRVWMFDAKTMLPVLGYDHADPFLTCAEKLRSAAAALDGEITLRMTITERASDLRRHLRALVAYNYGTRMDDDDWHVWAFKLKVIRVLLLGSGACTATAIAGGATLAGWLPWPIGVVAILAGFTVFIAGLIRSRRWIELRSIPRETLERFTTGSLLNVTFILTMSGERAHADGDRVLSQLVAAGLPFSNSVELVVVDPARLNVDGVVESYTLPVPARDLATLLTPAEEGDPSTVLHPETIMTMPSPPPSRALRSARFQIGRAVAGGEPVGIDPDGHGLIVGGSQSGKSSLVYAMLRRLLDDDESPGLFLVDPHESLADAFLSAVDALPPEQRQDAIDRLLIITPDEPEVVPLNLLAMPDFTWAGNTLIQVGKRIWNEFWGPRMQAALQALFRLAHGWNTAVDNPQERLSLFHLVFAAFRERWRREAMMTLPPDQRMGALALNTLLGQFSGSYGNWHHSWMTKVVSPIVSKVMGGGAGPLAISSATSTAVH